MNYISVFLIFANKTFSSYYSILYYYKVRGEPQRILISSGLDRYIIIIIIIWLYSPIRALASPYGVS
jgi:hypothetical protein